MAIGNPYRPSYGANDWTARLPPGSPGADTGMVVQPYTDPGYGMPNPYIGNLNQAPGVAVGGALRANALQSVDPSADSDNPLAQAPSWADAYGSVTGAVSSGVDRLGQWLSEQRAKSAKMGLWNDQTGLPTGKGLVNAAGQYGNALMMGTAAPGVRAFHGSPYDFERFDTSRIGTGEGAQAYGHGLYFAEKEGTARSYRDQLATAQTPEETAAWYLHDAGGDRNAAIAQMTDHAVNGGIGATADQAANIRAGLQLLKSGADIKPAAPGKMYEVNIGADPEQFLHWDKTVGQHPDPVRDKLLDMGYGDTDRGADVYSHMARGKEGNVGASQRLQAAGIPGIRYLDQGSRGQGQGTSNYVVFDAATIDILRKYGLAGLGIGLGGVAATNGSQQQPPMAQ
jgi:hypothetical protein